jgi:hypothetical protein
MKWSDISLPPSPRKLRQFAGLWTGFFLVLSGWQGWHHERWRLALTLAVLALAVGPLGLLWPRLIRPIYVTWMVLAFPIGWAVSHLVLVCVFYGVFTPLAIVFWLLGRDVLALRQPVVCESYWSSKPAVEDIRRYFRQF